MPFSTELLLQLIALVVFIVVLIYWSGWFSGIETALTLLDSVQLAGMIKRREKNSEYIVKLKKNMNHTLIAILIGNNIVNVVLSAVTALAANTVFHEIGISITIGVITFLIIIFGEITPKSYALANCKKVAQKKARTLYYLTKIFTPLIVIFIYLSGWILRAKGVKTHRREPLVTDENIKELVSLGQEQGLIKPLEEDIIRQVFHFGDRRVSDIMAPIKNVITYPENLTIKEAVNKFKKHSFTRIPVNNKTRKITGILNMKRLIGRSSGKIKPLLHKPLLVSDRLHIAVARDQKHRHIGIVTLEDILEELVGEIYDEFYEAKYSKRKLSKRQRLQ